MWNSKIYFEDNTGSLATAQALQAWANDNLIGDIIPPEDNPYLQPVNIPAYDSGDPSHFLIDAVLKFTASNLNNASYTHFYVVPNDYTSQGTQTITRSGTSIEPRTMSLYNGNDTHPGALPTNDIATMAVYLSGVDYWTFDRMAIVGAYEDPFRLRNSTYIVVNRHFVDTNGYPLLIDNGSHYFTVQNSRFQGAAAGDAVAMNIRPDNVDYIEGDGTEHSKVLHAKFISNEVVDANDGWQATVSPPTYGSVYQFVNVGGMIVHDNDFYLTDVTDRENGTDSKCGSPDPYPDASHDNSTDNPTIDCIMSGNRFWDYIGTSVSSGSAALIASMYSPGYKIYENIMINCTVAMSGGSNSDGAGIGIGREDTEINNNIFFQCGYEAGPSAFQAPVNENNGRRVNMHDNYFIENQATKIGRFADMKDNSVFNNNRVVDPYGGSFTIENRVDVPNDSTWVDSTATTVEMSRTGFTDYTFTKDKYTSSPSTVVLSQILDPNGTIVSPL